MKVLVLGATGATGRLIVGKAVAKGHEVVALVRSREKAADLAGAELVEGDARDPFALTRNPDPASFGDMLPFSLICSADIGAGLSYRIRRALCGGVVTLQISPGPWRAATSHSCSVNLSSRHQWRGLATPQSRSQRTRPRLRHRSRPERRHSLPSSTISMQRPAER